jgi:hypothetical protein
VRSIDNDLPAALAGDVEGRDAKGAHIVDGHCGTGVGFGHAASYSLKFSPFCFGQRNSADVVRGVVQKTLQFVSETKIAS